MDIGAPELLIILVIVIVVFGVGRIGKLGGELGSALREFRKGLGTDEASKAAAAAEQARLAETVSPAPAAAQSTSTGADAPKAV